MTSLFLNLRLSQIDYKQKLFNTQSEVSSKNHSVPCDRKNLNRNYYYLLLLELQTFLSVRMSGKFKFCFLAKKTD